MKTVNIFLTAIVSLVFLTGCGDSMSKLSNSNPQVYQKVKSLAECAGVQLASGQIANAQMAQQNATNILMMAGMVGAQYGVTDKDLEKIAQTEVAKWKGITLNDSGNLNAEMKKCTALLNSL